MDTKIILRLRSIKRRNFFSTLFKCTTVLVIMNSFPFKFFASGDKSGKTIRVEMNPLAVKRNKRG